MDGEEFPTPPGNLGLDRGTLGIEWESGPGPARVRRVHPGTAADHAGVLVGDAVVEVNGSGVPDAFRAGRAMKNAATAAVRLKVQRGADFVLLELSGRQ